MTIDDLAQTLRQMYQNAGHREKSEMILLFGIKYAKELTPGIVPEVIRRSRIGDSYITEVHKGRRLARYVTAKSDS